MCKKIFSFLFTFFIMTQVEAEIIRDVKITDKLSFLDSEKCDGITVTISPNAKKVAIGCMDKLTGKNYWKLNGKRLNEFDSAGSPFYFSPDSNSYAYVGIKDGNRILYHNDNEYFKEGQISYIIKFNSDSKKFITLRMTQNKSLKVIINNKEVSREWADINNFQFSPDGKKYMYAATDEEYAYLIENERVIKKEPKRYFNNKWKKVYQIGNFLNLVYSPDSTKIAYSSYAEEKGMCQYINGEKVSEYYKEITSMIFSPNSQDYAFIGVPFNISAGLVVKNGIEGELFNATSNTIKINDKGELLYLGEKDNKWYFIKENKKEKLDFIPKDIIFNLNGNKYIYGIIRNDKGFNEYSIILNNKETKRFNSFGNVNFSSDSRYFFYIGSKKRNDGNYISDIYINNDDKGNGKYEYYKIFDFYYDVKTNKLNYVAILSNDFNNIYFIEEDIIENNRPASN